MAIHSTIPAWKIPWTEEPGGLQSTGSQRVRHDWVTNTFTFHSLEGQILKLKHQHFGQLMRRADWLKKILMLGKIEGKRRRGRQRMRRLNGITDLMNVSSSKLWVMAKDREAWRAAVHGVTKSRTGLFSNWTAITLPWNFPSIPSKSLQYLISSSCPCLGDLDIHDKENLINK